MGNRLKLVMLILLFAVLLLAIYLQFRGNSYGIENSSWSNEGEWIVFSCVEIGESNSSLYLVRPDGSEVQRLTNRKILADSPTWSPDGEEIAFAGIVHRKDGVYKLKRGSDTLIPLTKPSRITNVRHPSWSPDGQWIAFISTPLAEQTTLSRVKADGSVQEPVMNVDIWGRMAWSPDSQWIAFTLLHQADIYKVRLDGSNVRSVVSAPADSVAWSPDGKQIAFDRHDIFVVQANGSQIQQLTNLPGNASYPTWSPDGQWIAFAYHQSPFMQLFKIKADGSELQQITHLDCDATTSDWVEMPGN